MEKPLRNGPEMGWERNRGWELIGADAGPQEAQVASHSSHLDRGGGHRGEVLRRANLLIRFLLSRQNRNDRMYRIHRMQDSSALVLWRFEIERTRCYPARKAVRTKKRQMATALAVRSKKSLVRFIRNDLFSGGPVNSSLSVAVEMKAQTHLSTRSAFERVAV